MPSSGLVGGGGARVGVRGKHAARVQCSGCDIKRRRRDRNTGGVKTATQEGRSCSTRRSTAAVPELAGGRVDEKALPWHSVGVTECVCERKKPRHATLRRQKGDLLPEPKCAAATQKS